MRSLALARSSACNAMDTLTLIYLGGALGGGLIALVRPPQMPKAWPLLLLSAVPQAASLLGIWLAGQFLITVCAFCAWVLVNRNIPGILLIALGVNLNLLVMAFYGGAMPISAELLQQLGHQVPQDVLMAGTKDIVVQSPTLAVLSDWIVILSGSRTIIASPGDLIAVGGILYWLLFSHPITKDSQYEHLSNTASHS